MSIDVYPSAILPCFDLAVPASLTKYSSVNKFGENGNSPKDSYQDIWDGGADYTYPTTATVTDVSQDADQAALRGGRVEVQGLDANWELVVQDVLLDLGDTSTPVQLDTALIRVFRMKLMEDVVGASDIVAHNAADTIDYALMTAGNNQTMMALYTVPGGFNCYLTKYYASMTLGLNKEPKGCNVRVWMADRDNGYEFQLKHSLGIQKGAGGIEHGFHPYVKIGQKTDIRMAALCYDNPGQVSAGFDMILEPIEAT